MHGVPRTRASELTGQTDRARQPPASEGGIATRIDLCSRNPATPCNIDRQRHLVWSLPPTTCADARASAASPMLPEATTSVALPGIAADAGPGTSPDPNGSSSDGSLRRVTAKRPLDTKPRATLVHSTWWHWKERELGAAPFWGGARRPRVLEVSQQLRRRRRRTMNSSATSANKGSAVALDLASNRQPPLSFGESSL